jgi:putative SOS response-associated peptidase YedK
MCGRFTLRRDLESVYRELRVEAGSGAVLWSPRYNIAPTDQVPILTVAETGHRQLTPMVWGIPRSRNGRMVRQINARAETVSERSHRCAVISDGFYEWAGTKTNRQPYFFHRPDDALILMAGLWQWHQDDEGYLQTFAIVTTAANATVAPVHDRMPALLEGDDLALWLNPQTAADDLQGLLGPAREDLLESRPVSPLVNSVKNDGPELIAASSSISGSA